MNTYVVIDLEMCNAPKPNGENHGYKGSEVIQIGAVRLDKNHDVMDSYRAFVQPQYTMLSPRIENLTGIHQEDLVGAKVFEEAIKDFFDWVGNEATCIVSWSDCDAGQLKAEMERKGLQIPQLVKSFENWIDSQQIFSGKIKRNKSYNLEQALIISDITYKEGAHDALVDAHNTALLFKKMMAKGEFKFNQYYCEDENEEHLAYGLAGLLSGVDLD